jgi:mannose-6-phosphate isomerase-like protein (cupin superfamily)
MKVSMFVFAGFMTAALAAVGDSGRPVIVVGHEQVMAALAGKSQSGTLVRASDLLVMGAFRGKDGQVEVHDKETDVFYIVDGEATLITGGRMLGGKVTAPGQWRGTSIEGGEAHHLVKGDVIVIPAGIPHWFKTVPHTISYFVVKVLKP